MSLTKGCKCKSGCKSSRCGCKKQSNFCGPGCECHNCQNITASTPTINEDSIDDSHSSSDEELCDSEHDEIEESDTEDTIDSNRTI